MNEPESILNILETQNLKIGYAGRGRKTVVADGLNLQLQKGELIGLLGPNGSGKSTLIRTLAHMQKPLAGNVKLEGTDLSRLNINEVAKKVSTVLTDRVRIGNLTVYNLIAFGRSPYTGMMGRLRDEDREVVDWAIKAAGLTDFVNRDIQKLSDGERQKVMIARALAQDTPVILLDEPTAHS
ncbi:MAG: ABC transporter ATP-binding protein [Balneolaceae bacterium]|nr:ABC transporter ATP-binding protein [Balneolaceae bacterium]